jgi:hypothetical protein
MVAYAYNLRTQRLRWEDCEIKPSLGYIMKPCLKKGEKRKSKEIN